MIAAFFISALAGSGHHIVVNVEGAEDGNAKLAYYLGEKQYERAVKPMVSGKVVFDGEKEAARAAGLTLTNLWRDMDDPNNVFFTLAVEDLAAAKAYLVAPESVRAGEVSGVIDGEYHFVQDAS